MYAFCGADPLLLMREGIAIQVPQRQHAGIPRSVLMGAFLDYIFEICNPDISELFGIKMTFMQNNATHTRTLRQPAWLRPAPSTGPGA